MKRLNVGAGGWRDGEVERAGRLHGGEERQRKFIKGVGSERDGGGVKT